MKMLYLAALRAGGIFLARFAAAAATAYLSVIAERGAGGVFDGVAAGICGLALGFRDRVLEVRLRVISMRFEVCDGGDVWLRLCAGRHKSGICGQRDFPAGRTAASLY